MAELLAERAAEAKRRAEAERRAREEYAEATAWEAAWMSQDRSRLEEYLSVYPDGRFADAGTTDFANNEHVLSVTNAARKNRPEMTARFHSQR